MANTHFMDQHFERDKNLKASGITVLICVCLFLIFFFVQWTPPVVPKPDPMLEGIEVNLGTSDDGSGTEQPMVQGEPGPTSNPDNTPQTSSGGQPAPSSDDNNEKDPEGEPATAPSKPVVKPVPNPSPNPKKADPKPPAPPKPKVTMPTFGGGTGKGDGNTKDSYNKPGNEGDGKGKGDKGQPDGKPGGKNYTGQIGKGNISVKGRQLSYSPSFIADVEPGVVTVGVLVSPSGTGRFNRFISGKFLASYKAQIIKWLESAKFYKGDSEEESEVTFNFKR